MFEDRERGYEAKWAHDEEALFRIMARRNTRLGEWAASQLQLPDARIDDYVEALGELGMASKGADAVLEKIRVDFLAARLDIPDAVIAAKAQALREEAEMHFGAAKRSALG
ncbi:MAG TPA: ATPase inhibitor subunit zeta [Rhizomicrobium sp.]|jgi:hypothetical protein